MTTAEKWGYSTLAVTIISAFAISGVLFVRLVKKRIWVPISDFLMGLGAATILCDAMLHLLPHALDLHKHEDTHDDHRKRRNADDNHESHAEDHGHSRSESTMLAFKLSIPIIMYYSSFPVK